MMGLETMFICLELLKHSLLYLKEIAPKAPIKTSLEVEASMTMLSLRYPRSEVAVAQSQELIMVGYLWL